MQDIQARPLRRELPPRYILYVGTRPGYKNFDTFIRAAAFVIKEGGGLSVVCCGGGDFNTDEKRLFSELGISDKIVYSGNISDQELKTVYTYATVFVFPSVSEGFGIPIVEAASVGCPLLLSDTDIFKELAGDCALYFDPRSIGSIKECLSLVLKSEKQRALLGEKAREIATAFSWEATFNKTKELYKSLL
jgi:glycosyltransferase involved in cell wall biosynthesis